jgi:hypothetical protein
VPEVSNIRQNTDRTPLSSTPLNISQPAGATFTLKLPMLKRVMLFDCGQTGRKTDAIKIKGTTTRQRFKI